MRDPPDKTGLKANPEVNFKGTRRSNDTHVSATDPETMLATKSQREVAQLSYLGHALMENRNGLAVDCDLTQATGTAERTSALVLIAQQPNAETLGADKNYDTRDFGRDCRAQGVTPHVAQNTARPGGSAIDGRTTRHAGYALSQNIRKRIETLFGDGKQHRGVLRQLKMRGLKKARFVFTLVLSVTNLLRMAKLVAQTPGPTRCAASLTG